MLEMNLEEILKLADELGIEYEVDSESPGFFAKDVNGNIEQVSLVDLFGIGNDDDDELDNSISNALISTKNTSPIEIRLDFMSFEIKETDKVAA